MSTNLSEFSPILEVLILKFDGYSTRGRRTDTCERTDGREYRQGKNGYDEPNGRLSGFMQMRLKPAPTVKKT